MNYPDELDKQIDDALHVIRSAGTPDGMQARLLRNVRQAPAQTPMLFHSPIWKLTSVACALVVTAGVAISRHNAGVKIENTKHLPTLTARDKLANPTQESTERISHSTADAGRRSHRTLQAARDTPHNLATEKEPSSEEDAAYVEMLAPSHPAPEMPLTQQEKLLLAAAKQREPKSQIAELRRPVWPLHDPVDDDDFQQFFSRPPSPNQPGDSE